mgnify:FL=1
MYQTASPVTLKTSGTRSVVREEDSLGMTQTRNLTNTQMTQMTQKTAGPINYATFKGKVTSLEVSPFTLSLMCKPISLNKIGKC